MKGGCGMIKFRLKSALVSILLAAGAFGIWYFYLEPSLIFTKTRTKQMLNLSTAVVAFNTIHNRLPGSLEEMVSSGILPRVGKIYYSPLAHETLSLKPLPYQECEFEFEFGVETTLIMIPQKTYSQKKATKRFNWLLQERRVLPVQRGTTFADPSATNRLELLTR
jgi:hypothetical protein